jgi:hypothetical protein
MILLLALLGVVIGAYVYLFRPAWFWRLGRRVRIVGYAYVAAILISAVVRLRWGI